MNKCAKLSSSLLSSSSLSSSFVSLLLFCCSQLWLREVMLLMLARGLDANMVVTLLLVHQHVCQGDMALYSVESALGGNTPATGEQLHADATAAQPHFPFSDTTQLIRIWGFNLPQLNRSCRCTTTYVMSQAIVTLMCAAIDKSLATTVGCRLYEIRTIGYPRMCMSSTKQNPRFASAIPWFCCTKLRACGLGHASGTALKLFKDVYIILNFMYIRLYCTILYYIILYVVRVPGRSQGDLTPIPLSTST